MHRTRTGLFRTTLLPLALGLAVMAAPSPAAADDVHLVNGNSFEGVVAVVEGDVVRIRLPHGELALPMARVARIDRRAAPLEEYLERKQALLERSDGGDAEAWLELATWSKSHGLEHSTRESAVAAAKRNPRLAGLADLLEPLGYVYDRDLGRWLSRDEHLRRLGWQFAAGRWWSPEEQEAAARERRARLEAAKERRREQLAEVALEQAIRARVEAEVARETAEAQPVGPYAPVYGGYGPGTTPYGTPYGYGTGYGAPVTGVVVVGYGHPRHHGHSHGEAVPGPYRPDRRPGTAHRRSTLRVEGSLGGGPIPGKLRSGSATRRP